MSFKAGKVTKLKVDPKLGLPSLTQEDCVFLLQAIGSSKFEGRNVEQVFNITLKLQSIYLHCSK